MKIRSGTIQTWLVASAALVLILISGSVSADDAKPSFHRVLFLGNSITRHGPKADIGWSGNWGMAASVEEKDYVHLVTEGLSSTVKTPCETMVNNIAAFEREYATYDLKPMLDEAGEFDPDLVILAIGENVPKLDSAEAKTKFAESVRNLLKAFQKEGGPVIVVRSCFWANEAKDEVLRQVCTEVNGIFVNIDQLGSDESNYARSEREFSHKGVAAHPGDKGMKEIADAILKALP